MSSSNLRKLEGLTPRNYDQSMYGIVVPDPSNSSKLAVNVRGNVLAVRWLDPVSAALGDTVLVSFAMGLTGQTEAIVRGKVTGQARPARAVVTATGSPTITVSGTDGISYTAYFSSSYTPTNGDTVLLSWADSIPTAICKVAAVVAPPTPLPPTAPAPPPPGISNSGQSIYPSTDSASFVSPAGWNTYAGGKGRIYQGNNGSTGQMYGAFWYAGSPGELSGATISRLQITLGARLPVGAYGSPVAINVYGHNSTTRPSQHTNVTEVVGPQTLIASAGQGPTTYDLSVSTFAPTLIAGGGIVISGDPFAGFYGRFEQADSGKLTFDWSV